MLVVFAVVVDFLVLMVGGSRVAIIGDDCKHCCCEHQVPALALARGALCLAPSAARHPPSHGALVGRGMIVASGGWTALGWSIHA